MGLAAGINFSMRSVLVTDTRYMAGNFERHVQADELLQMFGRAGRRGLDETGYVLFTEALPRLGDARPRRLKRATQVDWPSLISVMRGAADRGELPFAAAVELSHSLFSTQRVPLGVEHSLATGAKPCGLSVDAERARFVRRPITEMLNSTNEWELKPAQTTNVSLGQLFVRENERWVPALTVPRMLDGRGIGNLCKLREKGIYGREIPLATVAANGSIAVVKGLRKFMGNSGALEASPGRSRILSRTEFEQTVFPLLPELAGGEIGDVITRGDTIYARIDFSNSPALGHVDSNGRALHGPPEREALPLVCRNCSELTHDQTVEITDSPAYAWRKLGLVESDGTPTRRGIVFTFFHAGEGLAIAAALEDDAYAIDDLVFDLANIRAGPRFAGEDAPLGGHLGILCQRVYGRADHPGYLQMGVPVQYGSGASEVIREIVSNPGARYKLTNDSLRSGDVERALMEWRSLLRHIVGAPSLDWDRWMKLKAAAAHFIETTSSPASLEFPPLLASQQRR
jgi:hypothetical protein